MASRFRRATAQWAAQFWADLKASTDAGLLGLLRFLGLLYGPIDARLPIDQAFRKALKYRLAPHVGWRHALGGIAYLLFITLVVTGVLLSVHYRPSAQEAYPSVQHIVSNVTLGWLIRDLHVWSASLLVLVVLAHMARVFFDAAYRPPRETNWLVGVLLLFLVLAFGASGYLLPWDQWAYWTVTEALNALAAVPLIGGTAVAVLRGDPIVSGATLSRFFAMHVILLPWITLALVAFHFTMVRRHGVAPPKHAPAEPGSGRVFFPSHLLRSFMVAVLTIAVVVTAAVLWPRPVGDPANPAKLPDAVRSTWVVVDVSRALTHYLGAWGFVGFSLLALGLAFVPLFDRGPERDLKRRPVVATLGLIFFAGFVAAWIAGRQLRSAPPPETLRPASEEPLPAAGAPLPQLGPTPTQAAPGGDTTHADRGAEMSVGVLLMTVALAVQGQSDTTYGCVACHADKRAAFVQGVHAERGIRCHDCHGGDPAAFALPAAHRGGFVGAPGKVATVALCGSCHSDPNRMRQYGLPSGQVAEFRTSRHGRLLLAGHDLDAPTCTDCHDAHTILRPDDARSTVYPTNIPTTCARCHEDKRLMAKYQLPTDQVERYRRSAHGVALFRNQNFASPTCVGCHGSHSALPPTVREIANVCERCHILVGQAFDRGPHGRAAHAGKLAGCLGCHQNHDTERVPADHIAAACGKCHAAGTGAYALGTQIQQRAVQASQELRAAQLAIAQLSLAGRQTGDARFRYQTAVTAYEQIAQAQHSLDAEHLDDLARQVRSISRDLRGMAGVAEEQRWEHKLLLVPVWFLALASLVLAWFALRHLEGRAGRP